MGTAFVSFHREPRENQSHRLEGNITLEIGKIVFRSIVEEMELERENDPKWKGGLDAAYGIKYLYVGEDVGTNSYDYGPSFYRALERLKQNGPPSYYPAHDLQLFYDQVAQLAEQYLELRSRPEATT